MTKTEIIEKFWERFLFWGADTTFTTTSGKVYPYENYSEDAFWIWYVKHELKQGEGE